MKQYLRIMLLLLSCGMFWEISEAQVPLRESSTNSSTQRSGQGNTVEATALLPPSNDNCASAQTLTAGAACISGTTNGASQQSGEYLCISPGGGISPETVWYRFTATASSMVLGFVLTNTSNCATALAVYGPFLPGGGCLPGVGNQIICQNMGLIDPGFHPLLTSLVVGQDYLVQVQGNNCGGGNDRFANYCISLQLPSPNSTAGTASIINNCGVAFTGTTSGGHYANGTSIGANNLDNNNATTVAGASEVGDDVTFIVNNISWFSFCNGNAGSCNWSLNLNNVNGCLLAGLNAGVQAAVFTGSPAALTNVAISPSRIAPGGSFSSGTFAVAAGGCVYVMVDGFAGDECNYDLTLTNVSCPCNVLPVDLRYFTGLSAEKSVLLSWELAVQDAGLREFLLERSLDGLKFERLATVEMQAAGNNSRYDFEDLAPQSGWNHYRLQTVNLDGTQQYLDRVAVYRQSASHLDVLPSVHADELFLEIASPIAGPAHIQISDLQGRLVKLYTTTFNKGNQSEKLDLAGMGASMYLVTVSAGDEVVTKRFVKQ